MRFTAQEAFDASAEAEPILITHAAASKIVAKHDCGESFDAFWQDRKEHGSVDAAGRIDASELFVWLGY